MRQICLTFPTQKLTITLRDTATADAIYAALPFESRVQTWGDEVYFSIPVSVPLESDAKDIVEAGEIAFWTEGSCIAIGFGRTPISQADEIRLAARTNIWADAIDDVTQLNNVAAGETVLVTAVNNIL